MAATLLGHPRLMANPAASPDALAEMRKYVPQGAAHVDMAPAGAALQVSFVLLPKFTMLAFSSAIEPLRMANQLTQQVLFRWQVLSDDGLPVACSNGVAVMPDGAWGVAKPEGIILVCSGVEPEGKASQALGDWLRALWRRGRIVGGLVYRGLCAGPRGDLAGPPLYPALG